MYGYPCHVFMIDITKFGIFLLIVDVVVVSYNFFVVSYNFYVLMKSFSIIKEIPKNNATGIACEYLGLGQLIPINWAMIIINILFVVLK